MNKSAEINEKDSNLSKIPGISFRKDKQIVKNSPNFISDLDQIPFPARHLLPMAVKKPSLGWGMNPLFLAKNPY